MGTSNIALGKAAPSVPYVVDDRETPRFRVHRSTMVDEAILEEERRLIFDRSWLFVGHESEIKNPHDFRTRNVGRAHDLAPSGVGPHKGTPDDYALYLR